MNEYLIDLYESKIKKIEGSLYFGQSVDMDNPKEVAAMMWVLGWTEASNSNIEKSEKDRNLFLGL